MRADAARRLLQLLRPHRSLMIVSMMSRVVNLALGVAIPWLAVVFVVGITQEAPAGPGVALFTLVSMALLKGIFRYLEQLTGHAVAFRLLADLRNSVYRWVERIEPARLEEERSGDLVSRISGDISRVEPFYAHTLAPLAAAVAVPTITVAAVMLLVTPVIGLTLGAFSLLYLMTVPWIGVKGLAAAGAEARRLSGELAAAVADVVQGAREIAVLEAGEPALAETRRLQADSSAVQAELTGASARRSLIGGFIAGGAIATVAAVALAADLDPELLAVSVVVTWTVMTPLRALEQILPDTEQSLSAAARLFALQDVDQQEAGGHAAPSAAVRFESVTVDAGSGTMVESVDLTVPPGSFLGVVGPSGSGKSTLVSTLLRHRDPTSGRVLLGDLDVADLTPTSLRDAVALVPQRPDVFSGSILSNLLLAKPTATEEEARQALRRAQLLEWVETLDAGLDTAIGERGVGMSGGQAQRLALARVFLRDPNVMILDEATSELDAVTESAVLGEVLSERGARTLIVVAHRMETVVSADSIAVMDRGRLVETGTHDELKTAGNLYASLWARHEDLLGV